MYNILKYGIIKKKKRIDILFKDFIDCVRVRVCFVRAN